MRRRDLIRLGGLTAAGAILLGQRTAQAVPSTSVALAATDGHITLPGRAPLYIFGFLPVPGNMSVTDLSNTYKGKAQHTAPFLEGRQDNDLFLTLTNLGLVGRPDLTDSHTVHWHGFRTPTSLFDGVPEVSVAVPISRQFTYFFRPHNAGTYMYHCHFEDVEHVQMGMTGIVYVRPAQDGNGALDPLHRSSSYAYQDGNGSTAYDRHFAILLNEIEERQHDADEQIQEFIFTDYQPQFFTLNGRVYPQTILPNRDPSLPYQPNSSLVQVNPGDRALLRLANLGYQQHAMQLPGISLKVVGQDATPLAVPYVTSTLYIGPGEARDVLFTAPAFDAAKPVSSDARGSYNTYLFKNRDYRRLSNRGAPGLGGMATQVRVYQGSPLPAQTTVGETYA